MEIPNEAYGYKINNVGELVDQPQIKLNTKEKLNKKKKWTTSYGVIEVKYYDDDEVHWHTAEQLRGWAYDKQVDKKKKEGAAKRSMANKAAAKKRKSDTTTTSESSAKKSRPSVVANGEGKSQRGRRQSKKKFKDYV